jgi:hypothetical protein
MPSLLFLFYVFLYILSVSKYDSYISKYCVKLDFLYISDNVCILIRINNCLFLLTLKRPR